MEYKHVTLVWSLEGLSPSKLIADLNSEGFEGLYANIMPLYTAFFNKSNPFDEYTKIITQFEKKKEETNEGERIIEDDNEVFVVDKISGKLKRHYFRGQEPLSFGDLFKNKNYKNFIFGLDDDSWVVRDPKRKKARIWLSCWNLSDSVVTIEEPLNAFANAVLKAIGCDQPIEKIIDSDTFSLTHSRMTEELSDYNLKQASFEEQKDLFKVISDDKNS